MNAIVTAIKNAVAVEKKLGGLWVEMCEAVRGMQHEAAAQLCKEGEDEYKSSRKGAEIPSTYRSNKSVLLSALKGGVDLFDENGKARGKTDVEKALKEGKADKPHMDKVRSTLDTFAKLYNGCANAEERAEARNLLATLSIRLYEEAKAQGEVK